MDGGEGDSSLGERKRRGGCRSCEDALEEVERVPSDDEEKEQTSVRFWVGGEGEVGSEEGDGEGLKEGKSDGLG